jgi:putative flippase GtrA
VTVSPETRVPENQEGPSAATRGVGLAACMHMVPRYVRKHWPRHRDKVMYLVVGAWNMLFAYGCFSLLYYLLHEHVPSPGILAVAYAIASTNGFFAMRYLVFKPVTHPLIEYLRYQVVYVPLFAVNLVVLPLSLKYSDLNAYATQALFSVFAVIAGYLGSKYFAFRKSRSPHPPRA